MRAIYATDLSAASEAAIKNETSLESLQQIGVESIHLVTVVPSNVYAGVPAMNLEERRQQALDRYQSAMESAGFDVETHVVRGTPHRRINGIAEAVRADLSIVGSRGKSPLENRVIGSTARNLARTTVVPLLVTRIERETDEPAIRREHLFRRILFATDFSENSERAFDAFSSLRHAADGATLVHVESPKDVEATEGAEPTERLSELAEQLEEWDIDTRIDVRRGDPADEILAAAAETDPTTILLGSRGRSRLRRLLLGSVSESVVTRADENVYLVPPPRTA
ncbi:universal stress protein [Natrinema halophilum]|uniref:Universal stress protein n=1 Tax=Natrinema halophilum TaxID=1699371 RepID=A0A7D5GS21_9EURY|nr:universal stress protein [Natrinema halophilum]QLG48386.1 universal stress protein [Natrinema halophilum]